MSKRILWPGGRARLLPRRTLHRGHRPCVEACESRLLLHEGHGVSVAALIAPTLSASDLAALPTAAEPAAGAPLLPDMVPLVDLTKGYVYGWEYDTKQLPGRTLLRLTTAIGNAGSGAMELRGGGINADGSQNVFQRIYLDGGSFSDRLAGTFTYHPQHHHTHFDNFAEYRLRPALPGGDVGVVAAAGEKISFCLLDGDRFAPSLPRSPVLPRYVTCDAFQGISAGWADVYDKTLADQWIDVTGVADGRYWLEVVADPANRLVESDETNNVVRVPIDLLKPSQDPMVLTSDPAGQYPADVSAVEFRFDQAMDTSSFDVTQDVRAFNGPGGTDLLSEISGAEWVDPATLRIQVRSQTAVGAYSLTIGPDVRAADDGAPMDQDRDKVPGEDFQDAYAATFTIASGVGPDAFGYEARATAFEAIDLVPGDGSFTIVDGADDGVAAVSLGSNTFGFYGTNYSGANSLYVSTNGLIALTRGVAAFNNTDLSTDPAVPVIAPLWDDWRTDAGPADAVLGRFDDTSSDGVPDRLIVEWSGVSRYVPGSTDGSAAAASASGSVTFQAILSLNTGPSSPGAITFNYRDLDTGDAYGRGGGATVGIKGSGADEGQRLLVAQNNGRHPFVASGRAVRIGRPASVMARSVFYNHSNADGGHINADAADDAARAPDKAALLPGQAAGFSNYTSYSRGLNGVMVDVANLPAGALASSDFRFEVSVAGAALAWRVAPAPASVSVRRGAGVDGSDRVTLVWGDGAILNQWLRVTVLPSAATGLAAADVFSFGNLVGETGDGAAASKRATVNALDLLHTRTHFSSAAALVDPYDFNRDGRVNATDFALARVNQFHSLLLAAVAAPITAPSPLGLARPDLLAGTDDRSLLDERPA